MTPYYQDDAVTIYHGDGPEIGYAWPDCAVIADPPYGIGYRTGISRGVNAAAHEWPKVTGDDRPFDPAPWLRHRQIVLWGANHYADRLPASPTWLVWDKREGHAVNDSADCEMAWTNLGGPARVFHHLWLGMLRSSERGEHWHPNQKPVRLMAWVIGMTTGTVLDPYCGSGTTLRAAKDLGRKAIGIEIEERYCELAARRCAQEVLALR